MERRKKQKVLTTFLSVFVTVLLLGAVTLAGVYFLPEKAKEEETVQAVFGEKQEKDSPQTVKMDIKSDVEDIMEETVMQEEALPEGVTRLDSSAEGETVLAFAGDVLLDDSYSPMVTLKQRGGSIEKVFSEELLKQMRSADLLMINNEFTYTNRGEPVLEKQYTFRAKPDNASLLKDMGVDLVSLANNHAYDYGEISLTDTLDTLQQSGISHIGAGRNLEEAAAPAVYMAGKQKVAILAATQIERNDNPDTKGAEEDQAGVFRCRNPKKLYEAVKKAKAENDIVIVYIHWGTENEEEPDWAQKEQASGLAEAGADLIIGDHPHCLQRIEYVEGVPVLYSLGNYWFNSKTVDTCLIKAVIAEDGAISLQFLPALQEDCRTRLLEGTEKERVIGYMNELSDTAFIDENGYVKAKNP